MPTMCCQSMVVLLVETEGERVGGVCRLRERHQEVLRQKLYKLKQEQGVESEPLFPIIKDEPEEQE